MKYPPGTPNPNKTGNDVVRWLILQPSTRATSSRTPLFIRITIHVLFSPLRIFTSGTSLHIPINPISFVTRYTKNITLNPHSRNKTPTDHSRSLALPEATKTKAAVIKPWRWLWSYNWKQNVSAWTFLSVSSLATEELHLHFIRMPYSTSPEIHTFFAEFLSVHSSAQK